MIQALLVSSLEKAFPDDRIDGFSPLKTISVCENEVLSFQLLYTAVGDDAPKGRILAAVSMESDLDVICRTVENVPVSMPCHENGHDSNYLRTEPGFYPDYLRELHYENQVSVMKNQLSAVWFTVKVGKDAGKHCFTVRLTKGETVYTENTLEITVLPVELPKQRIKVSQWFHPDCLATYYHVPIFSEEHWRIMENFARTARENGINTILTPLLTPPLDTKVGGERPTVQLVDITRRNGQYTFDFSHLDRYLDLMTSVGMEYFEISHFFTQWGAEHAPKVVATYVNADGTKEIRRIFGWETDATGESYRTFLRALLTAFLAHMQQRGDDKKCIFHISDEPGEQHLESYKKAKAVVADLLRGYPVKDALSDYAFYESGVVESPIPSSNHIEPFLQHHVPDLWTYYCCSQYKDVSNRYIAMPAWRNRCIGLQFYKYRIAGFLQWGYNFYYNRFSVNFVNPYVDNSGEYWVPAGDTFSVYPAHDGTAYPSTRLIVFHEALQDLRAMELCEQFYSHDEIVNAIENLTGKIRFDRCLTSSAAMLQVREKINQMIAAAL